MKEKRWNINEKFSFVFGESKVEVIVIEKIMIVIDIGENR